jgi:hypothetical protein
VGDGIRIAFHTLDKAARGRGHPVYVWGGGLLVNHPPRTTLFARPRVIPMVNDFLDARSQKQ